jgi:thiol-disulfide isomerase/thioredoxin
MNLVSLEGEKAPDLGGAGPRLAGFSGRPVLLFFWAAGCGDCKAESAKLARLHSKYAPKGLGFVAPTRLYGDPADPRDPTPEQESAQIEKAWAETFSGLAAVPHPVDTETMVRYGVSATPTYALVDRKGVVRLYAPTRLPEADLSRRIESLLAESEPAKTR